LPIKKSSNQKDIELDTQNGVEGEIENNDATFTLSL
jgi:hypothetical protein